MTRRQPRFAVNHRASGLVEVVCPHGVGHPSRVLTPPARWREWMEVHGCEGCCSSPEWKQAEAKAADAKEGN